MKTYLATPLLITVGVVIGIASSLAALLVMLIVAIWTRNNADWLIPEFLRLVGPYLN